MMRTIWMGFVAAAVLAAQPAAQPAAAPPAPAAGLRTAPLREAIETLAHQAQLKIEIDARVQGDVRGAAKLEKPGEASPADARARLDQLLADHGLEMTRSGDVYRVAPLKDPQKQKTASVFGPDFGDYRGCVMHDPTPAGTVVSGYKKVVARGLMGESCHWEKVK